MHTRHNHDNYCNGVQATTHVEWYAISPLSLVTRSFALSKTSSNCTRKSCVARPSLAENRAVSQEFYTYRIVLRAQVCNIAKSVPSLPQVLPRIPESFPNRRLIDRTSETVFGIPFEGSLPLAVLEAVRCVLSVLPIQVTQSRFPSGFAWEVPSLVVILDVPDETEGAVGSQNSTELP
jgi:hypothetical protein